MLFTQLSYTYTGLLFMLFSTDSVRLTLVEPGTGEWRILRKDNSIHRKAVPYIIIAQPTEGQYRIACGGGHAELIRTGEAFLTAPNLPLVIEHLLNPKTERMKSRWIHFNFVVFDAIGLASLFEELPLRIESRWAEQFGVIAGKMLTVRQSTESQSIQSVAQMNELAFSLLCLLLKYLESKGITPRINPGIMRLLPVLEYARRHPAQKFEVADLARKANLSVPRFHAEFKRLFGDSPLDHVRKMRLSKASDMLRSGSSSLEEIARQTGFCNQFHLSREFKKCYGSSPSVFRKDVAGGPVV